MPTGQPSGPSDRELVEQALDALLGIAWSEQPQEVRSVLREQLTELTDEERRHMLDGFVDQNLLASWFQRAREGALEAPDALPLEEAEAAKVDAALEPLTRLVDPEAESALHDLTPEQRAHILFAAVSRRGAGAAPGRDPQRYG